MRDERTRWWQRTFAERHALLERHFGPSHPPGSAAGHVLALEWERIAIPGACCMVFPPGEGNGRERRARRDWLYVTHGLTQPLDDDHLAALAASDEPSGFEAEFAVLTPGPADWAAPLLQQVMWFVRDRNPLGFGDRVPMYFERTVDGVEALLGECDDVANPIVGAMRSLVVCPLLDGPAAYATSVGSFEIRVVTPITAAERDHARRTSSVHLLLLLAKLGIGQRGDPLRPCVFDDPRAAELVLAITALDDDDALDELYEST
jgi:hypothetical protein